ncbi:MAG: amidohydrolase family protein [Alphaproteobacteria bacterium]
MTATASAKIRETLDHPVIDADGHLVETPPVLLDYLRQAGGQSLADDYLARMKKGAWGTWATLTPEQRRDRGVIRPPFWAMPAHTYDRATALLPNLLRARLDDFGVDFMVVYPTVAIPFISGAIEDDLRRGVCRAVNLMYAEVFADHKDRMAPAAAIPTHTPQEAIEELEFACGTLGLKAAMIAGTVQRPLKAVHDVAPELGAHAFWVDPLALDSAYDYDPLWAKFAELRVAPATHNNTMGWGMRRSGSNFVYNHIGHFGAAGEAFAKALFLGGVTHRFPDLKFCFLEGGVGWAANLYNDLCEHWEKRNLNALHANLDPSRVDRAQMRALFEEHGNAMYRGHAAEIEKGYDHCLMAPTGEEPAPSDEFAACGIKKGRDIYRRFVPNFYFGCEADDRMAAIAFNTRLNHFDARLKAMFGSDVGHFDVTDMSEVLAEAHELVDHELISQDDFRDFTFANVAELHAAMNPNFFKGTVVEDDVAKLMSAR